MSKMITIISSIVLIVASIILGLNAYFIDRDINAWQKRAESVSSPDQMLVYMQNVKSGMENLEMTTGHAALFFPTPENDMGQIYLAVNDHIKNLQTAVKMDPNSNELQGMVNRLQHSIGDLQIPSIHYWNVHAGLIWILLWWLSLIAAIWAGLVWSLS